MISFLLLLALLSPSGTAYLASGDEQFFAICYEDALDSYLKALAAAPDDPAVHWRLARVYVAAGEVAPEKERKRIYSLAEAHARRCVGIDSTIAEGHTWLAAALGNIALFVGGKTKINLANEIKAELETALALSDEDDVTWSILGSFYYTVASVSWIERQLAALFLSRIPEGSYEQAEQAFHRAIALAPDVPRHQFELGKLYLDWGKEEEGYRLFRNALTLPATSAGDTVARRIMQERLREFEPAH